MLSISVASDIAQAIVNHQSAIIGPLAYEQAKKVPGIVVSSNTVEVENKEADPSTPLTGLVKKYEELFGTTSIEVCKDAVRELKISFSANDLPSILQ